MIETRKKTPLIDRLNAMFGWLVLVFLAAPIALVLVLSFSQDKYITVLVSGWTLDWYAEFINSPRWMAALTNSLIVGVASTVMSVILGSAAAIGLSQPGLACRRLIEFLLVAPMILPAVVIGVGIYFVFARMGLTGTMTGLILAHTTLAVPFVVVSTGAALASFDRRLLQAAASLGATPAMTFRRITLPVIAPGMMSGGLFAFATSLDEVVVTLFVAGPGQRTLPREMFTMIREQMTPAILAAAGILMLLATLFMILSLAVSPKSKG
jgi:putative spermidine/putrescine transport system permease protein